MRIRIVTLLFLGMNVVAMGSVTPRAISRKPLNLFVTEGLFQGGQPVRANIEAVRLASHKEFERWVIDFSDVPHRSVGKIAPEFMVRYIPGKEIVQPPMGSFISGRFQIFFRKIDHNFIGKRELSTLAAKSALVGQAFFYPAIEDGDMALELVLKEGVFAKFEAHQPQTQVGRLVLDIAQTAENPSSLD